MTIKAIFLGINKHLDSSILELSGARRDATALWTLFTDTIESLSARLLVDDAATYTEVSSAMFGTLSAPSADDVVVTGLPGMALQTASLRYPLLNADSNQSAGQPHRRQ